MPWEGTFKLTTNHATVSIGMYSGLPRTFQKGAGHPGPSILYVGYETSVGIHYSRLHRQDPSTPPELHLADITMLQLLKDFSTFRLQVTSTQPPSVAYN